MCSLPPNPPLDCQLKWILIKHVNTPSLMASFVSVSFFWQKKKKHILSRPPHVMKIEDKTIGKSHYFCQGIKALSISLNHPPNISSDTSRKLFCSSRLTCFVLLDRKGERRGISEANGCMKLLWHALDQAVHRRDSDYGKLGCVGKCKGQGVDVERNDMYCLVGNYLCLLLHSFISYNDIDGDWG